LFLGMLFVAAGVIGAIIMAFAAAPKELIASPAFHLARAIAYNIANVYMIKMAAVFMISLSTVTWLTAIAARWLAILGYVLALFPFVRRWLFRLGVSHVSAVGFHLQLLYSDRQLSSCSRSVANSA
jgi:hypothetical protein